MEGISSLGWTRERQILSSAVGALIRKKFARGYPQDNIIFENSETAVLIQNRQEVMRAHMTETSNLLRLVTLFFGYERPEIAEFRRAVTRFKADLPTVLDALRNRIDAAYLDNGGFRAEAARFLRTCQETINPALGEPDVREMLIQHILTEEIFTHVFNDSDFHHQNNIARELYALEGKFFTGAVKRDTLKGLEPYYAAIRANAAQITSHAEKQTFLKLIYENFYKVYDKKKADRLGVVYTPNEIVKFMIEGADWLCEQHFGRNLIDEHVEILDPATGTGTFICELLESFRGDPKKLAHKYKNELHANEVAILPYYVANLNIEATYAAISGQFAEYPNLCFVDTLDNVAGLGIRSGHQHDLFGAMSEENVARVKRQNARKISVIIGNPPYNANQQNENDNNKNREYKRVDELIRSSYIRLSKAQKTKVYDMYARFFRWASDRMHDDGVLAFVTNRSFIESRTFDGFRKAVAEEFNEIYLVDLGGDVRANPKLSGSKHNVFGIQTGVAISFMVKRRKQKGCKVFYARRDEYDTAEDKLSYLASSKLSNVHFERVEPDKKGNWLNLTVNDWDQLAPLADKKTKGAKSSGQERAIFRLFTLGVVTNRDEWVYAFDDGDVEQRVKYLCEGYEGARAGGKTAPAAMEHGNDIKWTRSLKRSLATGAPLTFSQSSMRRSLYRPFVERSLYFSSQLNEFQYQTPQIFPAPNTENMTISFSAEDRVEFACVATATIPNKDLFLPNAAQTLPMYRYTASGERVENITDWALRQFRDHYGKAEKITKVEIFHYVYGVLHDPLYREKYGQNLRREFPRIPFYADFRRWADWGRQLLQLHVKYSTVEPWPLQRLEISDEQARAAGQLPKTVLRADKENGTIQLDGETKLAGVPAEAWTYRLGNRSAIEWILDQYKEKTPKDPTIREKFDTYRFADYKEQVIDLLMRIVRVSVETVNVTNAMATAKRGSEKAA